MIDMTNLMHQAFPILQRSMGELFEAEIWQMPIDGFERPVYYILTEKPLVVDFEDKFILSFIRGGEDAIKAAKGQLGLTKMPDDDVLGFWQALVATFSDPAD